MVYPDFLRTVLNVPTGMLFGAFSALITCVLRILFSRLTLSLKKAAKGISIKDFSSAFFAADKGALSSFFGTLIFFIIYILLSYVLVFGEVRLYILFFMAFGYQLSQRYLIKYIEKFITVFLFAFLSVAFRILGFIKRTVKGIGKKLKIKRKVEKGIDKREEIL